MHAYTEIMCNSIFDVVSKQVHFLFVGGLCRELVSNMLDRVNDVDIDMCLREDPRVRRKRAALENRLAQFEEGLEIVDGVLS